jgi:hypothetical protein
MTNNKQLTAVEWLFAELKNHLDMPSNHANEILEQAKEMEKERIIAANRDGVDMVVDKKDFISGEQYYEQSYRGGEQ